MLVFSIWMIALLYNAYVVSCGVKMPTSIWSFIIAMIVAEIISKVIFFKLYDYLQ